MLVLGQRQRWRRRRKLLGPIASDLDDRPDQLAVLTAMSMLDTLQHLKHSVAWTLD
jgi:hypothetical protein